MLKILMVVLMPAVAITGINVLLYRLTEKQKKKKEKDICMLVGVNVLLYIYIYEKPFYYQRQTNLMYMGIEHDNDTYISAILLHALGNWKDFLYCKRCSIPSREKGFVWINKSSPLFSISFFNMIEFYTTYLYVYIFE